MRRFGPWLKYVPFIKFIEKCSEVRVCPEHTGADIWATFWITIFMKYLSLVSSKVFGLPYSYTPVVCAQACVLKCSCHPLWTRTLCSDFSWEKVVPMRVLKWKFPSRGFNSRLWEMDLFLKTRVTVLKTTRRTMVGSWQCLGPRERVLLILKLIAKCHLGCGVLGLGVKICPNLAKRSRLCSSFWSSYLNIIWVVES